jgi:hypothetical protein
VPFFLLPVLSTLFYTSFLRLQDYAPRLYRYSRINLILPLLTLPSCFFALSYAHTIATIVITIWMTLALISGIVVWRRGYYPARFFVLGFVALMVPGLLILPANVGLIPAVVSNAQLFTCWAARWTACCWRLRWPTRSACCATTWNSACTSARPSSAWPRSTRKWSAATASTSCRP